MWKKLLIFYLGGIFVTSFYEFGLIEPRLTKDIKKFKQQKKDKSKEEIEILEIYE